MNAMINLGDAFEFIRNGLSVKQSKEAGGVPVTRIETISDGSIDLSRVGYAGLSLEGNEKWMLEPGDILLSHINSVEHIAKCALYEGSAEPLLHGMNLLGMRPRQDVLLPRYAMWALKEPGFKRRVLRFVNKAVNQASISTTNLKTVEIPLPPLEDQRRIAGILDQADALRRLRTRALDKLNTLGQAIFHEMIGMSSTESEAWETINLSELVLPDDRINYGVVQPGPHDPEGVPIIRVADLAKSVVDFDSIKRIAPNIDAEYGRSRLKGGEVLIGCVGSIGTAVIAPPEFAGANVARAVARVPLDTSRCEPRFVAEQLRSQRIQNYFTKEVRLVAQPTLNIKQIRETEIILPPKKIQVSFVERVREIEAKKAHYAGALAACEALFASLQSSAFRGEV